MKNKKKLLVLLLLLLLASATVVTTAFAKYTDSKTGSHSAKVANWGITVTQGTNTFLSTYDGDGDTSVVASDGTSLLVAPGTKGTLDLPVIAGTAEVAVKVTVTPTVTITGWEIPKGDGKEFYCPIVFTINSTEIKQDSTNSDATKLAAAIAAKLPKIEGTTYAAGADVKSATLGLPTSIAWEWPFTADGADVKDTALGSASTKATVSISYAVTVEQVDTYNAS